MFKIIFWGHSEGFRGSFRLWKLPSNVNLKYLKIQCWPPSEITRFKRSPHFALDVLGGGVYSLFLVWGWSIKAFINSNIFMSFPVLQSCCFKGNARLMLGQLAVALAPLANAKQGVIFPTAFPISLLFFRGMNFFLYLKKMNAFAISLAFPSKSFNAALFLSTLKAAFTHTCSVIGSFSLRRAQHLFYFLRGERERGSQEILLLSCLLTTKEIF